MTRKRRYMTGSVMNDTSSDARIKDGIEQPKKDSAKHDSSVDVTIVILKLLESILKILELLVADTFVPNGTLTPIVTMTMILDDDNSSAMNDKRKPSNAPANCCPMVQGTSP
jgi:hypothetical protein